MLAEYRYHSSPWSRDLTTYETDTVLPTFPGLDDLYQLDIQTVELHGALYEQNSHEEWNILVDDDTCSLGTSHLSSELDEDIHTECNAMGEEMIDKFVGANCFINNLQEITGQDGASLTGMELLDSVVDIHIPVDNSITLVSNDDSLPKSLSPASSPTLPTLPSNRPRKLDHIPWSELTYSEQQTLLESISVTVSDILGPREQLDLLRIIDPDVQTLPLDGEFTIKPDFLDNEKLEKIHKLIASNTVSSRTSLCTSTTNSTQEQPHSTSPKSSQKKKQTKGRRSKLKAIRQRQRKEYKQNKKEKLSGLFQKEEVLALQDFKEEEEVDILG